MSTPKKILAVDDNPLNLEIVQEALGDDYAIKTAVTGEEALEIATEFKPDIVLLDIMMPGIDGYEVCSRLRANPVLSDTAIVMVSAKATVQEKVAGHAAGADDYITKPFEEEQLRESIEFFLQPCVSDDKKS